MRVFGYNQNKILMRLELSPKTIVEQNIDPWRLDLFDPHPIVRTYCGTKINHRRLDDVAFAYKVEGGFVFGMRSKGQSVCLKSRDSFGAYNGSLQSVRWIHPEPSPHSFEHHWLEYLTVLEREGNDPKPAHFAGMKFFPPQVTDWVQLRSSSVEFYSSRDSDLTTAPVTFAGEMLTETILPFALPNEINWVFERFGQFKPVIVGDTVRDAMRKKPIKSVELLLRFTFMGETAAILDELPMFKTQRWCSRFMEEGRKFTHNKCEYTAGFLSTGVSPNTWLTFEKTRYSTDCLYSVKAGEIRGSRIAFHDLALQQSRHTSEMGLLMMEKERAEHCQNVSRLDLPLVMPSPGVLCCCM